MNRVSTKEDRRRLIVFLIIPIVMASVSACEINKMDESKSGEIILLNRQIEADSKIGETYSFDRNNDVSTGSQNDQEIGDYRICFMGRLRAFPH